MTSLSLETIIKLPKAELHCHLDGSVRVSTIIELAKEQRVELPTFDEKELTDMVSVDETCESLVEYLQGFDITLLVLQKKYAITRVTYEVAQDAVADGIEYLEIRFSPILHVREGLSLSAVMEAVSEGRAMAEFNLPIRVRIIVCGMRHMSPDTTTELAEICWRYRHLGVTGFDLAGPEKGFSAKYHRKAFGLVRRKCINVTLHSGESEDWFSVKHAIQYCGTHRLGHGVSLQRNEELMGYVADNSIAIECCITSNVHTKAISDFDQHPIRKFYDANIIVIPCTDNPTVSNVKLSGEYQLLQKVYGFNVEEIVRMVTYGFTASFDEKTSKVRKRAEVFNKIVGILIQDGINLDETFGEHQDYYDQFGVPYLSQHLGGPHSLFDINQNEISDDVLRAIPKTDLHVKLDGSVDIQFIWNELTKNDSILLNKINRIYHTDITTFEDLKSKIVQFVHTDESFLLAKRIAKHVLQTKEQLCNGLRNVFEHAVHDGVVYMEIVFRPRTHTIGDLKEEEALVIIIDALEELNAEFTSIHANLVVYVSTTADNPISFMDAAKLTVKYKSKVVAFGVYGSEELEYSDMKYFLPVFHYLKKHTINVAIFAGVKGVDSILTAVSEGGARRISGAFKIHNFPRLMNYCANHTIPIEISLTNQLKQYTKDVEKFANPIRLFIDNHVPVTICSFRGQFSTHGRIDTLQEIINHCGLNISSLMQLLQNGFMHNFSPIFYRKAMFKNARESMNQILEANGMHNSLFKHWFPTINQNRLE